MKALLKYTDGYRREAVLAPLLKLLEAAFDLAVPLVMAAIIDTGIAYGDKPYIFRMCGILILLAAVGLVISLLAQWFAAKAATGTAHQLRCALFDRIQTLSYTQLDRLGTDTLITRMTSDVNQVQNGINLALRLLLRSPFIVGGAMVMAFTVDVQAAVVFVVVIPVLSVVVFGIMLGTVPMYRRVQGQLDTIMTATRENLAGARVIRAFGREEHERASFRRNNDLLAHLQQSVGRISGLMNPLTYVIVNLATAALIYTGAVRVDVGALTQGQVVALLNYMSQILAELVKLANLIIQLTRAAACAGRIEDILALEPDMTDGSCVPDAAGSQSLPEAAGPDTGRTGETPSGNAPAGQETPEDGVVVFRHVSLTYEGAAARALTDISFTAAAGETIGIIGGTGSGKSSLINLIPRFYDATEGEILVFGRNVRDYRQDELRGRIGIVPQHVELFRGTIEENLSWGRANPDEQEIGEALAVAQAKEFVDQKPGGSAYVLEQNGRNLSGGQRQRLTIARAVIRRPDILILDDAASALDFATDARLRAAIRALAGGTGAPVTFIVSQRAASVQYADRILVLDEGRLVGSGTHAQLLGSCAVYREIYYSQFPDEEM